MQIQVNSHNGVENKESLERWADAELRDVLSHFHSDITRVEVHLGKETSEKGAPDTRCAMEARLANHQPVAVTHHGPTQDEAFRGAAGKLKRSLESTLGRLRDHRDHNTIRKDVGLAPEANA
ncbi:HPF/RaiA family ribosome-associated protein [Variovorax sp. HJSM1_2]|uniref:HPF/RaiA family ribosome-associated protein n=1 Tax=Variovorax sp. HJSM1_2 TaxID=3366263 RepID=UPI003BBC0DFD